MIGNGTGLVVTERDAEGTTTFDMDPELFYASYLLALQARARDIDEMIQGYHYIGSWVDERRGLVTVTARPA